MIQKAWLRGKPLAAYNPKRMCLSLSHVRLFVIPWTVACQAPLSMGFSKQEYQSGQPFLSAGNLPDSSIKPRSSALQTDFLLSEPQGKSVPKECKIYLGILMAHTKQVIINNKHNIQTSLCLMISELSLLISQTVSGISPLHPSPPISHALSDGSSVGTLSR